MPQILSDTTRNTQVVINTHTTQALPVHGVFNVHYKGC